MALIFLGWMVAEGLTEVFLMNAKQAAFAVIGTVVTFHYDGLWVVVDKDFRGCNVNPHTTGDVHGDVLHQSLVRKIFLTRGLQYVAGRLATPRNRPTARCLPESDFGLHAGKAEPACCLV